MTEKGLQNKYEKSVANATGPPSRHDVGLIRKTMQDILPAVADAFEDFEPHPFGITKAWSNDFDYECIPGKYGRDMYTRGKVWFAFRFGEGKNDIPNISVIFHNAGCDVTINSEVQRSQKIVFEKIKKHGLLIDEAIDKHGGLQIKLYLKIQHKPFGYHWILMNFSKIKSKEIIKLYENIFINYLKMRELWISHIKKYNPLLSYKERLYLDNRNKNVNLALRFVDPITLDDDFWHKSFDEQNTIILDKIIKLKNLLYILYK